MESQKEQKSPSLEFEDCLKLLKGERDEQRLAGLLLVTKFSKGDDLPSLRLVYDAVGTSFLDRLLWTGMGKGTVSGGMGENRDVYLQLSVTVLAAFCQVPDIAASEDMVSKVPIILEILSTKSGSYALEECYEFLYLVSLTSEGGIMAFYESQGLKVLASHMPTFPDGSRRMKLAIKLVQLLLNKLSLYIVCNDYLQEFSLIVSVLSRQFSVLHDAVKFETLHLLSAILSSEHSALLCNALRKLPDDNWSNYMRDGVVTILQNRVAPAERLQVLILADCMISIVGERWLVGQTNLPNINEPIATDRCLLLVLEQSRVEVAVLLNELAYMKYEASKCSSSDETFFLKQRNLAVVFSLVEKIIKLVSCLGESEGDLIDENTVSKVIKGLNETIGVALEYLQDAKEHGQRKGNDLLASVRVIGSYLAETPIACKEKVTELLGYMLSIEGEDEQSPFYSSCFLLPLMCQMTMDNDGCKALVSSGGHKVVVDCLVRLIGSHSSMVEGNSCVFLACDTVLNLLLKKDQICFRLEESTLVDLLKALTYWTEGTDDSSVTLMASSICSLVFDLTSEEALLSYHNFSKSCLNSLAQLIQKSLASWRQGMSKDAKADDMDLLEIVTAGYSRWAPRFPLVRDAVEMCL